MMSKTVRSYWAKNQRNSKDNKSINIEIRAPVVKNSVEKRIVVIFVEVPPSSPKRQVIPRVSVIVSLTNCFVEYEKCNYRCREVHPVYG